MSCSNIPRGVGLIAALLTLVLSLAACGASSAAQNVDPAARDAAVQKAQAGSQKLLNQATQPNKWTGPDSSPRPKPGLRVTIIPTTMASTGASRPAEAMKQAGEKMGWNVNISDGQGQPDVQTKAIQTAVDEKVDAIALLFIDTQAVQAGVDRAVAAHIPIITMGNWKNTPDSVPNVTYDFYKFGQAIAQYMVAKSKGDLNLLYMNNTDIAVAVHGQYQGVKDYVSDPANCPGCTLKTIDWSISNLDDPNSGPAGQASAALQANPDLNWVSCFDSCMFRVAQAADRSGLTQRGVQGAGFDCSDENLNLIKNGGLEKVCYADPRKWMGLAVMDNINRITNGQPVVDYTNVFPTALFDKQVLDSLSQDQLQNLLNSGYSGNFDYTAKFYQLWGVGQ